LSEATGSGAAEAARRKVVKTKLPSVKNYDLFRYTLQQKQSLYDFIKIKIQEKTPLKQILSLVKRKFPWYVVNSQTAFKIYWECLKDEFRTYGSPDADDAYARQMRALEQRLKSKN
jgi:hypothetical protein